MHLQGSDACPQWEVHGIDLPRTHALPIRGCQESVESKAGMFTYALQLLKLSKRKIVAYKTNLKIDSSEAVLSKIC